MPDFFSLKQKLSQRFMRQLREEIDRHAPLSGQMKTYVMPEGDSFSFQTVDGEIEKQEFKAMFQRIEVPADLPPEDMRVKLREKFGEMTEKVAHRLEAALFDKVREATDKTGLAFNARGKPFHPSMMLDMLEKMDVDFDRLGNPLLPTMVVHPDMMRAIAPRIAEWESDPELQKRRSAVIAKKREEWLDREAHRKLVG